MAISTIIFYVFATLMVVSAAMVIHARNTVHGAVFLVFTFVAAAGLWMMLEAEFLSLVLVFVYVGAVMTLFLFVVMMLHIQNESQKKSVWRYLPFVVIVVALVTALFATAIGPGHFGLSFYPQTTPKPVDYNSSFAIGEVLYTQYAYPLELAAAILLVAIVSAIALAFRGRRRGNRAIAPSEQLGVKKADRLRVIKMNSEGGQA